MGAFNTYAAAKKVAENNKRKLSGKISTSQVSVEKVSLKKGVVYRAKLAGLNKNSAQKACSWLKKQGQTCVVIASQKPRTYAQR